nr:hypothetical protein [Tanacetum cinerariifolium]
MAPPVHTDEEIVLRNRWVQIRKSNCYLDLDKKQSNPIYKMAVDLLMHTNFYRAFTASSTLPSIYIQQFWDTIQYDKKAGSYRCQLDEQWRHKFYPRPDSLLHLPNEEPVLVYLKFSAKGSKREVFGMPIPGSLITSDIQTASYYQEYLASVAKHRKYLAGKTGSHLDSPAPMPTKPARKPKSTAPKEPPRPSVSISVISAQPKPTSAPAKPHEKKRKQATETSSKPLKAKKSKYGCIAAEDAELQKVLEESMKTVYAAAPQGPLLPVVIREPKSGKYQPLPEVPGKGKAKVSEEQVSHDLLSRKSLRRKAMWINTYSKGVSLNLLDPPSTMTLHMLFLDNIMADVNAPSGQAPAMAPPVHTDEENVLRNRAFTASSTIPSIYIQQFWDTIQYDKKAGRYRCQLDEQWESSHNPILIMPRGFGKNSPSPYILLLKTSGICLAYNWEEKGHSDCDSKHPPVLGYLKFSAKGSKREVCGMPIPGSLITSDIQTASYYQEYLASVAKHRKYLAGSHLDSLAPMPTKPARKPKSTAPKEPPRPSVSISVISAQPKPTSAPAKPHEKKRKQATETSSKPPKAKKSKYGWIAAEDAELQKVLKESMKTVYAAAPQGPILPVVIREPKSGKYQPLPEVPGKGKAKVSEEQSDSEEESKKVVLWATEGGNDEDQAGPDPGAQAEGQTGTNAGTLNKGQAGSNPDEMSKGQAGPDPGNARDEEQSIPSPVVHAGSDREHMDLDVADVSPQPSTDQLDEGFTATAYPKVQESLKLAVEEHVLLEEPASSSGTLSSLQHLSKDISFGDLFFSDRHSDADKNAKTEVESMMNVPIQQAMSLISLTTSPIIDLTSRPESPKEHQQFKATTTDTTTTLPPPQAQQQSTVEAMMASALASNHSPPPEDSLLVQTADMATFIDWFCKRRECHKLLTDSVDDPILRNNISKPLPLGGSPGQVTIQSDFFINKDLEYLRYGSKGSRPVEN